MFFIFLIIGVFILATIINTKESQFRSSLRKEPCKLHKWMYFDAKGWMPADATIERQREGRLRCRECFTYPNEQTNTPNYDDI